MANLNQEQKREIVEALACFHDVSSIVAAFHKDYGIALDRKQVGRYDPTRPYYAGGDKWRAIFEVRRQACLEDVSAVPIAHQAYRLNVLQEGVDAAKQAKNWPLVAQLLEQAAKEVGGKLTNARDVRVDDNRRKPVANRTPEERKAALTELFRQAIEQMRERGQLPSTAP